MWQRSATRVKTVQVRLWPTRYTSSHPAIIFPVQQGKWCETGHRWKKIAAGFGKVLGDEDLCGHEEPPVLSARKLRFATEDHILLEAVELTSTISVDTKSVSDIDDKSKDRLKSLCLNVIKILSIRIHELRLLHVKKKLAITHILKRVTGPWIKSPLAPAISFLQTKVLRIGACIQTLLSLIDTICFSIAAINGTASQYALGCNATVYLDRQANYTCLRRFEGDDTASLHSNEIKQRTDAWISLRNNAHVTGSTLNDATGLGTLRAQQAHHDKVFKGIVKPVTPELQGYFDHGVENEIHALATLVGKVIPVFYPNLKYHEDGCETLEIGHGSYAVVSGDGSGLGTDGRPKVAFELKCPVPEKKFTPDVYYKFPDYYVTQVISQMAAKGVPEFANICYTPQSATVFSGTFCGRRFGDWQNTSIARQSQGLQKGVLPPKKLPPMSGNMPQGSNL